jgi:hypothetical protein
MTPDWINAEGTCTEYIIQLTLKYFSTRHYDFTDWTAKRFADQLWSLTHSLRNSNLGNREDTADTGMFAPCSVNNSEGLYYVKWNMR